MTDRIDRSTWTEQERETERRLNAGVGRSGDKYVLDDSHVAIAVGLGTWAIWFEKETQKAHRGEPSARIVKQETIGEFRVSTVFLGLDHSFGMGPRLLFETMVFPSDYQERYPTWDHAMAGHEDVVRRLRAGTLFEQAG